MVIDKIICSYRPLIVFVPTFREQQELCEKYQKYITFDLGIDAPNIVFNHHALESDSNLLVNLNEETHYLIASSKIRDEGLTFPNLKGVINPAVSISVFITSPLCLRAKIRTQSSRTIFQRNG